MPIEAMKQALDALEANGKLINGDSAHMGLREGLDSYYAGCFAVDEVNKLTEEAITALRTAIEEAENHIVDANKMVREKKPTKPAKNHAWRRWQGPPEMARQKCDCKCLDTAACLKAGVCLKEQK